MSVKRIVPNIAADKLETANAFYRDTLGMSIVMDHGWIRTFAADPNATQQISVTTEGGSGTAVPDISIEVNDLSDVHRKMRTAGVRNRIWPRDRAMGSKALLRP